MSWPTSTSPDNKWSVQSSVAAAVIEHTNAYFGQNRIEFSLKFGTLDFTHP